MKMIIVLVVLFLSMSFVNTVKADCGDYSESYLCDITSGCVWDGASCYNESTAPCYALSQYNCSQNYSCTWTGNSCMGNPTCSDFSEWYICNAAGGCFWDGYSCHNQ